MFHAWRPAESASVTAHITNGLHVSSIHARWEHLSKGTRRTFCAAEQIKRAEGLCPFVYGKRGDENHIRSSWKGELADANIALARWGLPGYHHMWPLIAFHPIWLRCSVRRRDGNEQVFSPSLSRLLFEFLAEESFDKCDIERQYFYW